MFWELLEQSAVLQQLPHAFSLQASRMQLSAGQHLDSASMFLHMPAFHLWESLQRLQPSFQTDHVKGQQCIVPAMQLGLASLQYISKAVSQGGRQDWRRDLLRLSCNAALDAATAAVSPLEYLFDEQEGSSSDGSSDSIEGVAADVLQAEETLQCICLSALVPMLVAFLQQAPAMNTATNSTASTSSRTRSSRGNSASSAAISHGDSEPTYSSCQTREQWLPAALAHSMPAGYSSMLEQLGCSREVGLWLATELQSTIQRKPAGWATDSVMVAMKNYMLLLSCAACVRDPQVAAMHLSLAANCLQWLSSMPPDTLLRGLDDCCTA
jgi:hypothetical protein